MLRTAAALILAIASSQISRASEWQWLYCIAPSHAEHKLYMSPVFEDKGPASAAELAFAAVLNQSFLHYNDVQCPRSEDQFSAMQMQLHTIRFNQRLGVQIINLRWKPALVQRRVRQR
jgi:hypothetical protein